MNKYRAIAILILLYLFHNTISSQSIELDLPHFKEQGWWLRIFQGEKIDTISKGTLDQYGKVKISLPQEYKNYRGMSQWVLTMGGGLDIILASGEYPFVACTDENPKDLNIRYKDTEENTFLINRYRRQQNIFAKVDAIRMAIEAYKNDYKQDNSLITIFETELKKQKELYANLVAETTQSSLYAARFSEIVDYIRGYGKTISEDMEENNRQLLHFMLYEIDMEVLYTSGHWMTALSQWLDWYNINEKYTTDLPKDYRSILQRIKNTKTATAFKDDVQRILRTFGRNDLAYTIKYGGKAPKLVQGNFDGKKTVLVFFETGCGFCESELKTLNARYEELKRKGYKVISISADKDKEVFANTSKDFKWKGNYCDFKGFLGEDFINYGVTGTPTLYLIDQEGLIKGRYASVKEIEKDL